MLTDEQIDNGWMPENEWVWPFARNEKLHPDLRKFARTIEKAVRDERCKWMFAFNEYIPGCHVLDGRMTGDVPPHCMWCGKKVEVG